LKGSSLFLYRVLLLEERKKKSKQRRGKMFCKKCGKEIKEGVRFCPYCGAESGVSNEMKATESRGSKKEKTHKKSIRKKIWAVAVLTGILLLCGGGAFAMYKAGVASERKERQAQEAEEKKEARKKKESVKKEEEEKVSNETKEKDETYPQIITLDADVQNEITDFLSLLCKLDAGGNGKNFSEGVVVNEEFAYSFLIRSIWFEIPFVDGESAKLGQMGWEIPEETVREYLENSIGTGAFNEEHVEISDGMVVLEGVTPTSAYGNDTPQIMQVKKISEDEIEVYGEVHYTPEMQEAQPYSAVFDVTLIENSQSMWGGYTLQSVNTWTEKSTNQDKAEGQKNPLAFRVSASSTLQEEGYDHSTAALLDRNPATCWIEGVDGVGIGEYLLFDSEEKQSVRGIAVLPGYLSSEDIYTKNGSPLELEIKAGDRIWTKRLESYVPNFSAPMDSMIYIDFGQSISVDSCIVTIKDSRSGTKYDDICIAEMFLYGE
jgi:uncharacterized Zn finger protein (UPF0148 family)